jgi:hypothetical protein
MKLKCPKCGSIIYSRRNVLCGVCGERLPDELLFTPKQRQAVEQDLEKLKQQEQDSKKDDKKDSGNRYLGLGDAGFGGGMSSF